MANIIPNGNIAHGQPGQLPDGWQFCAPKPSLSPSARLMHQQNGQVLVLEGNGEPDCLGWVATSFPVAGGQTYRLGISFRLSGDIDPYTHLLVAFIAPGFNHGIFHFTRTGDSRVEGESRFFIPGSGLITGEIRILFKYSASGSVSISEVSLEECAPVASRPVRVACTNGLTNQAGWEKVLDRAGEEGVDLVLLPEDIAGPGVVEDLDGPSPALMRTRAARYGMHVAGGFLLRDTERNRVYNVCALFGPDGKLIGLYRKNHLYVTEYFTGVSPGTEAPVFATALGKIGIVICYDSFFTDVFELQALRGAEIILFPNAGYYRSLLPARAADHGVRIVASSWTDGCGIWDTSGCEVTGRTNDDSRHCACTGMFGEVKTRAVPGAEVFHCDASGMRRTDREVEMLFATLDLSVSAAPHHRTGPMSSGPGGHRNRRGQRQLLLDEIHQEYKELL